MATQVTIYDPVRGEELFEAKMAYTTRPVEVERMLKSNEMLSMCGRPTTMPKGISLERSTRPKSNGRV